MFEADPRAGPALVRDGLVDGLRIDHPDGLADPPATSSVCARPGASACGSRRSSSPGEQLRDWPVSGTVGYEFLNDVCALFVDPAGEAPLTALWQRALRRATAFGEVAHEAKLEQAAGDVRAGGRAAPCPATDVRATTTLAPRARVAARVPDLRRSRDGARRTDEDRAGS